MRTVFCILLFWSAFLWGQKIDFGRSGSSFIASGEASTKAQVVSKGAVLNLTTTFRQDGSARACWDLPLSVDLSQNAGIRLRVRCLNADLASQIDLFLHIDGIWHKAQFTPNTCALWEEQVISKASFSPEGNGGVSWRKCDRLRIAAWRGSAGDFSMQIAHFEFIPANVKLALVRGGGKKDASDANRAEALRYSRLLGEMLSEGGIYPAVIDEVDVTQAALRTYSCVALPSGEFLGENAVNQLCAYVRQGGKVGAFYVVPPRLANTMHLPGGRFMRVASLPQPLTQIRTAGGATFRQNSSSFLAVSTSDSENLKCRAWWVDATGHTTKYPAIIQCPYGFWMTHVFLKQDSRGAIPVLAAFFEEFTPELRKNAGEQLVKMAKFAVANAGEGAHTSARRALKAALERQSESDYPGIVSAVSDVREALANEALPDGTAYVPAIRSRDELRGVWTRSASGLPGEGWSRTLRRLKLAQYNAVFPHFLSPYGAAWPSKFVAGRLGKGADGVVGECVAAAANLKIEVHAWVQCLSMVDAPAGIRGEFEKKGRLQRKINGMSLPWLCPTQRENRLLLVQAVSELARKYAVDGIHLDMVRYESSAGCYCERCRAAFARFIGHEPANWPDCTREPGQEKGRWEAFRCNQITHLAQELSKAAKAARPKVKVSAAVYPNLDSAKKNVGQDWLEWLRKDIVDFVCPMDYRPSAALLQGDLSRQRSEAGEYCSRIYPGLGVTVHNLTKGEIERQIQAVRSAGMEGYVLFEMTPDMD